MLLQCSTLWYMIDLKMKTTWTVFQTEDSRLSTATGVLVGESPSTVNPSALVAKLKAESGLTADQLGRLLGVSRRSIHNWAAGSAIAPLHEEKVRELGALVFSLPADTPDERRQLLLDSSNGTSLFRQFATKSNEPQRVKFGVPVEERLGL